MILPPTSSTTSTHTILTVSIATMEPKPHFSSVKRSTLLMWMHLRGSQYHRADEMSISCYPTLKDTCMLNPSLLAITIHTSMHTNALMHTGRSMNLCRILYGLKTNLPCHWKHSSKHLPHFNTFLLKITAPTTARSMLCALGKPLHCHSSNRFSQLSTQSMGSPIEHAEITLKCLLPWHHDPSISAYHGLTAAKFDFRAIGPWDGSHNSR